MKCNTCAFYKEGQYWNGCKYFQMENFAPMEKDFYAYSTDGKVSPENEQKIWLTTRGAFGQPIPGREAELLRLYRKESI